MNKQNLLEGCHSERGSIFVLSAVLMVAILGFVALSIDAAILSSARTEKLYSAEYAALGALQAYARSPANSTHAVRLANAIARAESTTGLNFSTFQNKSAQAGAGQLADGSFGSVTAGRFWNVRPPVCNIEGCPCTLAPGVLNDGCFQPCEANGCARPEGGAGVLLPATAISLELRTSAAAPIRNAFAGIIGANSTNVSARAVAVARPSHGIILLDVSPSTIFDTIVNGPFEPLQRMTNVASAIVANELASSDRETELGLIAFDDASRPANLTVFPLAPVSTDFAALTTLLSTPISTTNQLYPRAGATSDLPRALNAAVAALRARPDFSLSFNHIILLTTGLTQCTAPGVCPNTQLSNALSLQESLRVVSDSLARNRIVLSVSLAGRDVSPHSVLIRSPTTGRCMTGAEKRRGNYLDILTTDTDPDSRTKFGRIPTPPNEAPANYYLPGQYLYAAAAQTGGKWFPLRDPCLGPCTPSSIDSYTLQPIYNDNCTSGPNAPATILNSADTALYTVRNTSTSDGLGRKTCGDEGCNTLSAADFARKKYSDLFFRFSIQLVAP